jgi:hypothetical protein
MMSTVKTLDIRTQALPGDRDYIRLLFAFGGEQIGQLTVRLDDLSEFIEGLRGGFDAVSIKPVV